MNAVSAVGCAIRHGTALRRRTVIGAEDRRRGVRAAGCGPAPVVKNMAHACARNSRTVMANDKTIPFQPPFHCDGIEGSGRIHDANGMFCLDIRGWGHLTGTGGLHLPEEEAAKLQDEFIEFVLAKINA